MNRWLVSCCLIAFCATGVCLSGCHLAPTAEELQGEQGGGLPQNAEGLAIWHMPFNAGTAWRCTQGANGSYSHQYTSTRWDLDLDTPNPPNPPATLFAPTRGAVYVHNDTSGFGIHINLDLGDGTYIVLGHLREAWVKTGNWVEEGQPLGLAGCTGACSGDHVHIGVHRGNAAERAGLGTSVQSAMFAADVTGAGGAQAWDTDAVVCGLSAGHFYESQLPAWEMVDEGDDPPEDWGDDDTSDAPEGDDDDATPDPADDDASDDEDDDDAGDDDATPPSISTQTLCWWPTGLINPHNGELWVKVAGQWETIASVSDDFVELCGTVDNIASGDVLTVNGEYSASNALSDPWWICSNWGSAGGLVVHGEFTLSGAPTLATSTPNGVGGCDVHVVAP